MTHRRARPSPRPPTVERLRVTSPFSDIIVKDRGTIRTLYFVRDDGRQAMESQMDMAAPHALRLRYTRAMFASYLFVPQPRRVLMIGLGAGAMVRFLERYEPDLTVDAVDIDPAVVAIAVDHFGVRRSARVTLTAADGLQHVRDAAEPFDVIYVDAYLKLSAGTDPSGVPLQLKTRACYGAMRDKLTATGVVVFNLHVDGSIEAELAPIRAAFASTHVFAVPHGKNHVVVATNAAATAAAAELLRAAAVADRRFQGEFSVAPFVADLLSEI